MKIKCKECNGEGAYEVACWEQSKMVNCECSYCDGQGYIEEEIEEFDDDDVTDSIEICDKPAGSMILAFAPRDQKTYHITYFIERGNIETEATPLLGGLTLNAAGITHAITSFINSTGVAESEIKYIVEL
jgi:putative hemolysin